MDSTPKKTRFKKALLSSSMFSKELPKEKRTKKALKRMKLPEKKKNSYIPPIGGTSSYLKKGNEWMMSKLGGKGGCGSRRSPLAPPK